jgi:hypothetical protein
VGGSSDLTPDSEVGDKSFDFGGAHFPGMTLVMKEDETTAPIDIGLFGAIGVVLSLQGFAHLVKEFFVFWRGGGCVVGCHGL